jgi:uncharacterized protein YbjT (DUF2867 family)
VRVLLLGATGLIGSHVLARLQAKGHGVIGVARGPKPASLPDAVDWLRLDLRDATRPEVWLPHLSGVDAVVNCAGVLQDGAGDSVDAAHRDGPAALFAACERTGVRRVIHLSAIGADRESLSAFSASKRAGDEALAARDLEWVILRPSVVLGHAAYGGSALFRGMAALPFVFAPPAAGPLQVVQLDELVETILFFLKPEAPSRLALEIAGPERLEFVQVVQAYRRWLGYKPARVIRAPAPLMALAYRLGDLAGLFGWRPPIRSTGRREMVRGAVGDPAAWTAATGIRPRSLSQTLAATPASVQERWFSGLYLLKGISFAVFALFWIGTGIISLGPGYEIGEALMLEGGAGPLSGPSVVAGALADILIGLGIAYRRTSRLALWAALGISIFYLIAGTAILPRLWADPLGPMWKIWPIMAFNFVLLSIRSDR